MKKFLYLVFLFALLSATSYSQFDIWQTTTNAVGNVWNMVIDPNNQNIMYSGSNNLGVFKTTDGGTTWSAINTGLTNTVIQALAISPSNSQVLYAGTGVGGGVFKTTNGGTSWTIMNTGITESSIGVQALLVHPTDPNTAWVCIFDGVADAVNGIYKTTNGGTSWSPATNGLGAIKNFLALAMSPANPNTLFLGSSFTVATSMGPSAIYKSTDGGANWFLSSTGLPTDPTEINPVRTIKVSSANPNVVVAGLFMNTVNGGFYASTDGGATWTKKHNGLPTDVGTLIRSAAIRPTFDNQFYVGLDRSTGINIGVFMTTDGGNNWVSFNGGVMLDTYAIRALVFNTTGTHTLFAGCSSTVGNGVYEYNFSVVPVEFTSFTANVSGNDVVLNWSTATETNNQGFEVEKLSGNNWVKIGFIAGHGTTTEIQRYSYTDNIITAGKFSYRLKQIDYNGSFEYSDVVEVEVLTADNYILSQNYPNPFNPATKISFAVPVSGLTTVKVVDVLGNEVAVLLNEVIQAGSYDLNFTANNLPSGVYFYTLQSGNFTITRKMVLLK